MCFMTKTDVFWKRIVYERLVGSFLYMEIPTTHFIEKKLRKTILFDLRLPLIKILFYFFK